MKGKLRVDTGLWGGVIPGNVPLGAVFNGLPAGSLTGFSVAQAGDFNADSTTETQFTTLSNVVLTVIFRVLGGAGADATVGVRLRYVARRLPASSQPGHAAVAIFDDGRRPLD